MSESNKKTDTPKQEPVKKPLPQDLDPFAFYSGVVGDSADNIRKKKS